MTKITVNNNGPLLIEGECTVVDPAGRVFDLTGRARVSLCRCGQSENKPFCDGAHKRCEFRSEVKAPDKTLEPSPQVSTSPQVKP